MSIVLQVTQVYPSLQQSNTLHVEAINFLPHSPDGGHIGCSQDLVLSSCTVKGHSYVTLISVKI